MGKSINKSILVTAGLVSITACASFVLMSSYVSADDVVDDISITVPTSCTMSGSGIASHTAEITNGTYQANIGTTTINALCNDNAGFSIYAAGYTGEEIGGTNSNKLVGTSASGNATIDTGTATGPGSQDVSNWAMQLATNSQATYPITLTTGYDAYHAVPNEYTKVATRLTGTDVGTGATGSTLTTTYAAYISKTQPADTYSGKVKYTLIHPNDAPSPASTVLYDAVASMSKGTQTETELRAEITTSNSGVYEYDSSVFGTSSDAANTSKIYYYRGILDDTTGSYGSDGDNAAWPNTVVLSSASSKSSLTTNDTCWRIVRTTGSGGVKMIYQGKWTGSTCANAETSAQVATSTFNGTSSTYRQIVRVGYTHNSTYAVNTSQSGTIAQVFGSNSNPGANDTRSTIKEYIEDTWYADNMTSYTSKLEASAGYCNDRTMNTSSSWTTPLAESSTIASTYGTSSQQVYHFGAYPRNANTAQAPSLTCGNKYSQIDRSIVDLYRYVPGSTGVSNELKYPAALITADEAAFAGSGSDSSTTPYNANSFLRSGSYFWLLSPNHRPSAGFMRGFALPSDGYLNYYYVGYAYGVRPAISLTSGTTAVSGTGTAANPWIVNP